MKTLFTLFLILPILSFSQIEEKQTFITEDNDTIIAISPEYPGGSKAMSIFIRDNFKYPEMAREMGEQGTIWIEFVVYNDGVLRDVKVVKGVSESLDAESIRVIEFMPRWKPAILDGKKVNVRYTIPIKAMLGLTNGQKRRKKRKEKKRNRKSS